MPSEKLIAYIPVYLEIQSDGYEENLQSALESLSTHAFGQNCLVGSYRYRHEKTNIKDILIKPERVNGK